MDASALRAWASFDGCVGRKEYWLHYLLPGGGLLLLSTLLPPIGWVAAWTLTAGTTKRVRDFQGAGAGITVFFAGGLMAMATLVAAVLMAIGFLFYISGLGGDDGGFWTAAAMVFFLPLGGLCLIIGFTPGRRAAAGIGPAFARSDPGDSGVGSAVD